jgi:hypothetical protein
VLLDEAAKPFPERTCLGRHCVEFPRKGAGAHGGQYVVPNELGLRQPSQQVFAATDPFDNFVDGRRDRVQEIEPESVCDEEARGAIRCYASAWALNAVTVSPRLRLRFDSYIPIDGPLHNPLTSD